MADEQLERIADAVAAAEQVCALTGAGISTDSGIPDFRGPQGVWTKDPSAEQRATIQVWRDDRDHRVRAWADRAATAEQGWPEPNDGHRALVALQRLDRLDTVVTQNIDGLHAAAGTDAERLVEVHGTAREVACLECGHRCPTDEVLDRVRGGEEDPHCEVCGGLLKSATISFGQALDPATIERAERAAATSDVFLALGTSLAVYPVALLPAVAARMGAFVVIVNGQATERDADADEVVIAQLGDWLPRLATAVRDRLES